MKYSGLEWIIGSGIDHEFWQKIVNPMVTRRHVLDRWLPIDPDKSFGKFAEDSFDSSFMDIYVRAI
jgi:hypothetical protein